MRWDAEKYDSTKAPQVEAGRELIAMARVRETDSILDIGCGTGRLTLELARLASGGNVIGIDPSDEMLEKARSSSSSAGNLAILSLSAQEMDFKEEFDLVFSNSALQWVKEQEKVMKLVYKALKPGGRIAVQLPAKDFCWELMENIYSTISTLGLEDKYAKMSSPWRFPLMDEFAGFLQDAGFGSLNIFYRDYNLVFESINEVSSWAESAALRPYLALLNEKMQGRFKYAFAMGFENYRTERGIEFGFRRLFALASKG